MKNSYFFKLFIRRRFILLSVFFNLIVSFFVFIFFVLIMLYFRGKYKYSGER